MKTGDLRRELEAMAAELPRATGDAAAAVRGVVRRRRLVGAAAAAIIACVVATGILALRPNEDRRLAAVDSPNQTTSPTKVTPSSPDLSVEVSPRRGAPGTVVTITATGCTVGTANFAVSFNNKAEDPTARNDPSTVRTVGAHREGDKLVGTYTIRPDDVTGGSAAFIVQCDATLESVQFDAFRA